MVHVMQSFSKWQQIAQYQLDIPPSWSPQLHCTCNFKCLKHWLFVLPTFRSTAFLKQLQSFHDSLIKYKFFKQVFFCRTFLNYSNLLRFDFLIILNSKRDNLCWSMKSSALFKVWIILNKFLKWMISNTLTAPKLYF